MKEKAIVEKIHHRSESATVPTLLNFQNGSLAAVTKENTQFCRILNTKEKTKEAMVVTKNQVYHGPLNASSADALTDMYICVRNKASNKVRILPIEQASLTNHVYHELKKKVSLTKMSDTTLQDTLLKQFGGRKASRFMLNKEKMKVDVDVVKDDLDATVKDTSLMAAESETPSESRRDNHLKNLRPPFNADANKIHEIYDLRSVIPSDLLDRLDEEARVVYATSVDKLPITSEYLLNCIKKIQQATSSNENLLKIKVIIYMDCLRNVIKSRMRTLEKEEISAITEKVENDVRHRFSDPNGKARFSRTIFSTEKSLCYFIVLALLISDNYRMDVNILSQELCTPRRKVVKYAQIVFGRMMPSSDVLTLKLPRNVSEVATLFRRPKK